MVIKNILKNNSIRNSLILSILALLFLTLDLLSKNFYFKEAHNGFTQEDWGIIGIRSFRHENSTFFSFLNINTTALFRTLLSIGISIPLIIWLLLEKSKTSVIALSIMICGVAGNTFDTIIFGYVRDILFAPWWDRGTFNFADVLIVFGSILLFISLLTKLFKRQ